MSWTARIVCLIGSLMLAQSASAQTASWTIKPAEKQTGGVRQGVIYCEGKANYATGFTPEVTVFATPSKGGVVYMGPATVLTVDGGTDATFTATVSLPLMAKIPNDTYSVWAIVTLTNNSTLVYVCPSVETATVTMGAGMHTPQGTISFTAVPNQTGKIGGAGAYTITNVKSVANPGGWEFNGTITLYSLPAAPAGGAVASTIGAQLTVMSAPGGAAGTYTANLPSIPGTYNVIAILPLRSGTIFNTVSSGFQSVVVK